MLAVGLLALAAGVPARGDDLFSTGRLRTGLGDRASLRVDGRWVPVVERLERLELDLDLFQVWLPHGWDETWVTREQLREMARRGITPVVVHYFFGDDISKERIEAQREAWYTSLWRMARLVRMEHPVLVVLEPEWNIAPPEGETAVTDWPWFARDLRAAARMIRREAPNARVGTCPGDFPGVPHLEPVLGPVADELDFLAFQEMRADTDPDRERPGYREVGAAAVDYARYLKRAFGRPLLLGYVAVSSHGGWEDVQAQALRGLLERREALREAGVFGWVYFQLRDDPRHRGYFGPAERHFGLLTSDGRPKPALRVFRRFLEAR